MTTVEHNARRASMTPCDRLVILGAGQLATLGAEIAIGLGLEVWVFLAPRAPEAAEPLRALG